MGCEPLDPPQVLPATVFGLRDPAGLLVEIAVAAKNVAGSQDGWTWSSSPEASPARRSAPKRQWCGRGGCRTILVFTTDIDRAVAFYSNIVGLRLSDRSDRVAFMHAIHGSRSSHSGFCGVAAPGLPPLQLDMSGIDDIGLRHAHGRQRPYRGWASAVTCWARTISTTCRIVG